MMPPSKPTGPGYVRFLVLSPRPSGSLSPIPNGCLGLSRKASINPLFPTPNLPRLLSLGFPVAKGQRQGKTNHQSPIPALGQSMQSILFRYLLHTWCRHIPGPPSRAFYATSPRNHLGVATGGLVEATEINL